MNRTRRIFFKFLFCGIGFHAFDGFAQNYLHEIPLKRETARSWNEVRIFSSRNKELYQILGPFGAERDLNAQDSYLRVPLAPYRSLAGTDDMGLAPSFFVDFDEPVFQAEAKTLNSYKSPSEIQRFVFQKLKKNTLTSMLPASRVWVASEGDCTEHAVLLAALLRRQKIPVRMVMGLMWSQQKLPQATDLAYGHAWVDYFDAASKSWKNLDATHPDPIAMKRFHYLPLMVLRNEGPGLASAMLSQAGVLAVDRIVLTNRE